MTKTEMEKRIKELGGLNLKTALIVSIEKWKGLADRWQEEKSFPYNTNCALCKLYHDKGCMLCPLESCGLDSQYVEACHNINLEHKPAFMKARRNIIRRMQRALKRLEAEEK